ncbi:hypothetical protein LZ31DRAFT_634073 [Colletotrichum somersetense]|nr:hypothetical protein LZ31DRAFT_634073 [Colletotrichum somersetense]
MRAFRVILARLATAVVVASALRRQPYGEAPDKRASLRGCREPCAIRPLVRNLQSSVNPFQSPGKELQASPGNMREAMAAERFWIQPPTCEVLLLLLLRLLHTSLVTWGRKDIGRSLCPGLSLDVTVVPGQLVTRGARRCRQHVQSLELGLKAAVSIVKIYRSVNGDGWTARNADLQSMAKDPRNLCNRLKEDVEVKLDPVMERLVQRCTDTADELSSEFRGLFGDIATSHQKWAKFKGSLAAYFMRGKIDGIQARFVETKTHVFGHVQILLYDHRVSLSRSMRSLEEVSEAWNRAAENRLHAPAHDLSKLCEAQSAAATSTEGLRKFSETWTRIKERQSEIPKARRRTFEWVFREDSPVSLGAWLRESSGLFWIKGKPGSGKSTLMKFILSHEQTMRLADRWASPYPLIVASHFFWSAGTTIQKSQEGLLRTLLFQILVDFPELIPSVCPTRYSNPFGRLESWGIEELSEVFGRLKDIHPLPSRILLLIDGLGEYNGYLGDLVQFMISTSQSPYIKVCCASRPWPVFSNEFKNVSGRIHVHDLTANDMMRYIRDTLGQRNHFEILKQSQETEAAKLVKDIAEKSEGVFFWVSLVHRLSEFPSDLDRFFQRMLDTIDAVYKDSTAMVFSMLLRANSSLPLIVLVALDNDVSQRKDRILGQCRDLVQAWEFEGPYGPDYNLRLGFLHRTVVEFLERVADTQWQSTLPFQRYLLARSYLSLIPPKLQMEKRDCEPILRFLYTLQGADVQEIVESQNLTKELSLRLFEYLSSPQATHYISDEILEEMELLSMQAFARILIAGTPGDYQSFDVLPGISSHYSSEARGIPWFMHGSGYVEVGDWAQVSWSRIVDKGASDLALTPSSTIEWLRINRVFSDSELRELEEAFPPQNTSGLMALQKKKEERYGT